MITEKDLQEAIAECEGERNPNANTCMKLAAFYTIRRELFGDAEPVAYSHAAAPPPSTEGYESGTEFGRAIREMDPVAVLGTMDELMSTLEVVQPRLYAGVMRKLGDV